MIKGSLMTQTLPLLPPLSDPDDPLVPCAKCNGHGTKSGKPHDVPEWARQLVEQGGEGLEWAYHTRVCVVCNGHGQRRTSDVVNDALLRPITRLVCRDCGTERRVASALAAREQTQWCAECEGITAWDVYTPIIDQGA